MTPQLTKQPDPEHDFSKAEDLINKSLAKMHQENHVKYVNRFRSPESKNVKWISILQRWLGLKR